MRDDDNERLRFQRLQQRLPAVWRKARDLPDFAHTSVVVPSLSVDPGELAKIEGAPFYEERLLFTLMRLRHPTAHVVFVSSQPIHPDIVDYYLHLLGIPVGHARARLTMLSTHDGSDRALSSKILDRPRLIQRIRRAIVPPGRGYLTCFNSTARERRLAVELGIPLNGVDPQLLELGTKSGARRIFAAAGVDHPAGFEELRSRRDIVEALVALARHRPGVRRAVVKLNDSFSGEGNAVFEYPGPRVEPGDVDEALLGLRFNALDMTLDLFLDRLDEMGGIVEELVEADELRSPSVQLRIEPDGELAILSTHDQLLGGPTGQTYLGCRFPADPRYRGAISSAALAIGRALGERGVISRFAIDFVVSRRGGEAWSCHAIEINLRMGGTTPPFMALQLLSGGRLEDDGEFRNPLGHCKYYQATDNLKSPAYRGLLPDDLTELMIRHGLRYSSASGSGVIFHMIGALSQYGKVGLTSIGNSPDEARLLFERTVHILDHSTAGTRRPGRLASLLDRGRLPME